jgi:hypothetical protein
MCEAAMDLCINAGIIGTALSDPTYPDEVRENFEERLGMLTSRFRQEIENIQGFGESLTTSRDIQRIRDSVALPLTVGELYDSNGKLRSEYIQHTLAERAIQRVHKRAGEAVQDCGKLPPGIRQALKLPLIWVQIVNRYPWESHVGQSRH